MKFNLNFNMRWFAMKTISMLDFRNDAERILAQVIKGERMVLTRRGKPVARLEPITEQTSDENDSFYSLMGLVESGKSLSNKQIDDILYGQ
jgi:prevent-host-death family protein